MGIVKPLSGWKVGTVNSGGSAAKPYCAMVSNYERGMVLAVARNDKGMGSLAIDFKDPVFETNVRYPVWVDLEGGVSREFQGYASSDRSLVVQFGKDSDFYKALTRTSRMDVSSTDVDISFSMAKALSGSRKLESCAGNLIETAAGDTDEAQEVSDNPIDAEASRITAENIELQKARAEIAELKAKLGSAKKYDDIDSEISRRMAEHEKRHQARVTELEERAKQLEAQLAERKEQIIWSEEAGQKNNAIEKKVAGLEADKIRMADELDAMTRQNKLLQAALEDKAVGLKQADAKGAGAVEKELAELRASSGKKIAQLTAALEQKSQDYEHMAAQLSVEKQKSASALPDDQVKAFKAQVAMLEKQLAELKTLRSQETARAGDVQAELAKAREELAELRQSLPAEQQRVASLQSAMDKRQAELDRQAKVQSEESKRLELRRGELEKLRGDIADNQYQGTMETRGQVQSVLSSSTVSTVQLSAVQAELKRKQDDLERQAAAQKAEAEWLEAERARLEQLKASSSVSGATGAVTAEKTGLENARKKIAELEKSYRSSTERIAELESALKQRLAGETRDNQKQLVELNRREAELAGREQLLSEKETELGRKLAAIDKKTIEASRLSDVKSASLTDELGKTKAELLAERKHLEASKAEVARLQKIISGDQLKIAELQAELAGQAASTEVSQSRKDEQVAALIRENAMLKDQLKGKDLAEAEARRLQSVIADNRPRPPEQSSLQVTTEEPPAPVAVLRDQDVASKLVVLEQKIRIQDAALAQKDAEIAAALAKANEAARAEKDAEIASVLAKANEAARAEKDAEIASALAKANEAALTGKPVTSATVTAPELSVFSPPPPVTDSPTPAVSEDAPEETVGQRVTNFFKLDTPRAEGEYGNNTNSPWSLREENRETSPAPVPVKEVVSAPKSEPARLPEPVASEDMLPVATPRADMNKAAAFLESIMAVHRGRGSAESVRASSVGSVFEPSSSSEKRSNTRSTDFSPSILEPQAGDESFEAAIPEPLETLQPVPALPPQALPVTEELAPVSFESGAADGLQGLRKVLSMAGITPQNITPGGDLGSGQGSYYQWTTGQLNGLFEQRSWQGSVGNFQGAVEGYLDRYREDCPGQLTADVGAFETVGKKSTVSAYVACGMSQNSYVTSFVFQTVPGLFTAILHTGLPQIRGEVLSTGERVKSSIRGFEGAFVTGVDSVAGAGDTVPARGGFDPDSFETVYVQ